MSALQYSAYLDEAVREDKLNDVRVEGGEWDMLLVFQLKRVMDRMDLLVDSRMVQRAVANVENEFIDKNRYHEFSHNPL